MGWWVMTLICINFSTVYQDYQITRIHPCTLMSQMTIGRGKKLKAYKYPHISQMMAKPRLALILIPLIFLSSSLVPSYALYFLHHCPIHAPQSIDFWSPLLFLQAWVHAFLWAFRYSLDEINQNTFTTPNSHPQSHTTLSASEITP